MNNYLSNCFSFTNLVYLFLMDLGLNVKQPDKIVYLLCHDKCNNSEREILNPVLLQDNEKKLCVCSWTLFIP